MVQQNDILLTGLIGSNPLGALAAFGLLRMCGEIPDISDARLYWVREQEDVPLDDWVAVLRFFGDMDRTKLVEKLVISQQKHSLDIFKWSEDIRVPPKEYREHLVEQAEKATLYDRLYADYYVAFGSEIVTDDSQGLVKPTAFHMTSGKQKFLKIVSGFGNSMYDGSSQAFEEALFGPWLYLEKRHSLGWDPSTERIYAYRHKDPSKKTRDDFPRSVLGAIWLAVEALPLFPTAVMRKRLATTGFVRKERNTKLVWPIWTKPIGIDTLRSLLMTSELVVGEKSWEILKKRGVAAVYQSVRSQFGQGYAILRPASLAWCL